MDYYLFHLVNQFAGQSGILDAIMTALAKYGVVMLALPLLYMWFRGGPDAKKAALLSLLSMALALIVNQIIGHIYFRPRPFAAHEVNLLVEKSTDPSFPSDHAAFVFGIAWVIWLQNRRIGYVALAMGAAVAISRVFIGTHYPGDVISGAIIGLGTSLLVWNLRTALDPITSFLVSIARKLRLA